MILNQVPFLALLLLNVAVLGYVMRLGDRTRSGFFLVMNGLALILWAGGLSLFQLFGEAARVALSLSYLGMLLVPANFAYHALTRPREFGTLKERPVWIVATFLPVAILPFVELYDGRVGALLGLTMRVDSLAIETTVTRAAVIFSLLCLLGTVAIQTVRYHNSEGPDKNLSKHLIVTVLGPLLFAAVAWAAVGGEPGAYIPAPGLLFAIMAQGGVLVVIRQEELRNPLLLRRIVYLLSAVLVSFVLVTLLIEVYGLIAGRVVVDRTVGWLFLTVALLAVLALRFSRVESRLDDLIFERAAEYRRVVDETRRELAEARDRLRRSERLSTVGELTARMAHEIKNPLGPIRGYTQMMREKLEQETDFRHREAFLRHLAVIAEEVDNIDRRVRELLASARPPELSPELVDVEKLAERCVSILRLEAATTAELNEGAAAPEIELDLEEELPPLEADKNRLEEALFNIGRNALEALAKTPEPRLRLLVRRHEVTPGVPGILLAFVDNGPGMDAETIAHLWEPFRTGKSDGTGLGLAIVRSIAEAHGGSVEAIAPEGGGCRVEMRLPLMARFNPGAMLPRGHSG
jgi:signal transduction histidine kinase